MKRAAVCTLLLSAAGCQVGNDILSFDNSPDIATSSILSRAHEWVGAKLQYCQSPNHERDYDSACSEYCERQDNSEWDPYRSDCSGFVSWSWGLPAPGRTTYGFAPFETDITHEIDAIDLQPGDAINNSDHVMLFQSWVDKGHTAVLLEEPGCSSSTPYAHEVTTDVSISGTQIYVPYNGMTFTAIHFDGVTNAAPAIDSETIAVASWGTERLDLFARDINNHLRHRYWSNRTWSGWEDLGGSIQSAPTAVSWANNRIDTFARGTNNHLLHWWWDGTKWHDAQDLGGGLSSAPSVMSQAESSLDVFVRGGSNHLEHLYFRPGTGWSSWESLGGTLDSAPAAAGWAGHIEVFARGSAGVLGHLVWNTGSGWSSWMVMESEVAGNPSAVSWGVNRIDLFGTGADDSLRHRWMQNGTWSDWESLGGNLDSAPTVASWASGRLDVFARGDADHQLHKYFETTWSTWLDEGAAP
jgi:hypothetical protein